MPHVLLQQSALSLEVEPEVPHFWVFTTAHKLQGKGFVIGVFV